MSKVLIIGLGNVLMGDDAFGPSVIRDLEASYEFGPDVSLLDAGTPGSDLDSCLAGQEAVILVDTVRSGQQAGRLCLMGGQDLLSPAAHPRFNAHQSGLRETMLRLQLHGRAPGQVLLVGVVPSSLKAGIGLSPAVAEAVQKAANEVVRELKRLGCPVHKRKQHLPPNLWWEAPPTPTP